MSSGSYFKIFRKLNLPKASAEKIAELKNEFYLGNKSRVYSDTISEEREKELRNDYPKFMPMTYSHEQHEYDDSAKELNDYLWCSSEDGTIYMKPLEFHFCSSFTALKEKFHLDAYSWNNFSIIISEDEARKMLQAIDYILNREYSKKTENMLRNEYVEAFGHGYPAFVNRFRDSRSPIYIDKEGDGYVVNFNDYQYSAEVTEEEASIEFDLKRAKVCLEAYLDAEHDTFYGEDLILEYSTY